jgi:hypothetical protein
MSGTEWAAASTMSIDGNNWFKGLCTEGYDGAVVEAMRGPSRVESMTREKLSHQDLYPGIDDTHELLPANYFDGFQKAHTAQKISSQLITNRVVLREKQKADHAPEAVRFHYGNR